MIRKKHLAKKYIGKGIIISNMFLTYFEHIRLNTVPLSERIEGLLPNNLIRWVFGMLFRNRESR